MAQSKVEVVRRPLQVRERSRRTLDQRLSVRFPGLAAAYFGLFLRLPPASRLRQAVLGRVARLALEAFNRRDLNAVMAGAHPAAEYHPEQSWVEAGLVEPCYRGLEGYRKYVATVDEVWGGENHLKPKELIDLGERFVMLAVARMRAQASGVQLTQAFALISTVKDGRVVHLQEYYDHDQALAAVGLS